MAQRVVIGTCVLVTAACLALVGLLWQQAIHAQRLAAEQTAYARAREQETLKQLHEMTEAIQHPRSLDWNRVRMSLRAETADGPPLAGVSIDLNHWTEQNSKSIITPQTNEAGVADFGLLHPGEFWFDITRNWGEGKISTSGTIRVQPGEPVDKQIVCPGNFPTRVGVRWDASGRQIQEEPLVLALSLRFRYLEIPQGMQWAPI